MAKNILIKTRKPQLCYCPDGLVSVSQAVPNCMHRFKSHLGQFSFFSTSFFFTTNSYQLTVCTKGSHFPYILLTAQEVRVYFIAMITLRRVPACEHSTYTCLTYQVCDYITLSIYSTIAYLYGAPLIFVYGAGPPKVSSPSEGHGGEQHINA